MNREIKIQVLFVVNNKNFTKSIKEHYTSVDRLMNGDDTFDYITGPEIIAKRQFTGLQDKNGTDIYEGDIITGGVGGDVKPQVIEWENSHKWAGMSDGYITHRIGFMIDEYYFTLKGGEVIGNIYQNPELLVK